MTEQSISPADNRWTARDRMVVFALAASSIACLFFYAVHFCAGIHGAAGLT